MPTSRERFRALFEGKADRPPFVPLMASAAARLMQAPLRDVYGDAGVMAKTLRDCQALFAYDAVVVFPDLTLGAEALGCTLEWPDDGPPSVAEGLASLEALDALPEGSMAAGGRMPALTPAGERRVAANRARRRDHPADSWADRNLWERCITRGTPRVPNNYNSNILILQTPDAVVLLNEMINETRVVGLDGRPHLEPGIRLWNGDSRGHWEGDTLVVQTTNFSARQQFRGLPVDGLRLVERFTRTGPDRMDYEMTLDDPAMYTRTWTVVLPMTETGGPIFEYACHEGNYGMEGILAGHRAEERVLR